MALTRRACYCLVTLVAFLFFEGPTMSALGTTAGGSVQRLREVRSYLKLVNKAPLMSIQSPDGDIIDCVPISKQPAFDHPLLKNHTIQMLPSYHPGRPYDGDANIAPHPITQTWHQNGGNCPENTIPIRRTKEEDVLRASSANWFGKKRPENMQILHPQASVTTGHTEHAVAYSAAGNYYGTKMTINLWKPPVERREDFSLAQLWISAGSYSNNDLNTIEAGWQVYPALYQDYFPRLFIYWTRDGYKTTGCYNLLCSGFVQTNNLIAIGGTLSPQSVHGGTQYEFDILVWKDPNSSNWWLQVRGTDVGYWPSSIFTTLQNSASNVHWGGEVYSSTASQTSTCMGACNFPNIGYRISSYIRNIQFLNSSKYLRPATGLGLISTSPKCYDVKSYSSNEWGTHIYYGGPGRDNPGCQK